MFFKKKAIDAIVVGLGNPGRKYDNTRHNIGFCAIDDIASFYNTSITRAKFDALYATVTISGKSVLLLKPQTYMNLSGVSVKKATAYYKVNIENVVVLFDDISLDVGKLRIRDKGSAGGHNGLKSIIDYMGENFPRVKIGVGAKPHADYALADWVLSRFTESENKKTRTRFDDIRHAVEFIIDNKVKEAQSKYNG